MEFHMGDTVDYVKEKEGKLSPVRNSSQEPLKILTQVMEFKSSAMNTSVIIRSFHKFCFKHFPV